MIKRILFLALILISVQAIGQKHIYTDYLHARRGIDLKNQMITEIDTSSDFSTARHDEIATRLAIKEFVESNGGGSVNGSISKVNDYSSLLTDVVDSDFKLVKDFKYKVAVHPDSLITRGGLFEKVDSGSTNGATTFVDNQGRIWKRMNSDQFINPDWFTNMHDADRVEAAITLANSRLTGRHVICPGREMIIYDDIYIDSAQYITVSGVGTTWKASPGSTRNTTLASTYVGGTKTIDVDSVPTSWEIGDIIVLTTDGSNSGTSSRALITSISGNTIGMSNTFTSQSTDGSDLPDQPAGSKIVKVLYMFVGRPSQTENTFGDRGVNRNIVIEGITFDGSKNDNNRVVEAWTVNFAISIVGRGSEVRSCKFTDFPSEVIAGHGLNIHDNVFESCGGSPYHISGNDTLFTELYPTYFSNNTVINCNTVPYTKNGHNEGIISLSWNGGYLIAANNWVTADSSSDAGFIGSLTSYPTDHDREIILMESNYITGLPQIAGLHQSGTRTFSVVGNVFEDMGVQNLLLNYPNQTITFCGNQAVGTTVLNIPPQFLCDYDSYGDSGVGIGKEALKNTDVTTYQDNTAIGKEALKANTNGNFNIAVGAGSLLSNPSGDRNTFVGTWSGLAKTSGSNNVGVGYWANGTGLSGDNNTFIGAEAGRTNSGSGNVFVGYKAGVGTSGSDKLIVHNTDATSPLLEGSFSNRWLNVAGSLGVGVTNPTSILSLSQTHTSFPKLNLYDGSGLGFGTSAGNLDAYTETSHRWFLGATVNGAGTQEMVLNGTGLGIGTTNPSSGVDAPGVLSRGYFAVTNPDDNILMGAWGHNGNGNAIRYVGNSVNNAAMTIARNTGAVTIALESAADSYILNQFGLGLTNPAHPLDVAGSSNLNGSVTVNESGSDADFRVEGVSNSNLIQADALLNGVGINTAAINGNTLSIKNRAANVAYVEGINSSGVVGFEVVELSNSEHALRLNDNAGVNTVNIGTGEATFINNDDPVSFGTTTPFGKLYVKGRSANAILAFFESQTTQGHIGVTNTTMGSTGLDGVWIETDGNNAMLHNKETAGSLGFQAGTFTFNALEVESDGDVKVHSSVDFVLEGSIVRSVASNVIDAVGTGSPEGVLTAGIGSVYRRTDGGSGTSFYIKESGTGNTGWVAK